MDSRKTKTDGGFLGEIKEKKEREKGKNRRETQEQGGEKNEKTEGRFT